MAPMAGRIPYGKKNRLVCVFRQFKCFVAPWVPIDWVGLVLQEIGAGRSRESVRHGSSRYPKSPLQGVNMGYEK